MHVYLGERISCSRQNKFNFLITDLKHKRKIQTQMRRFIKKIKGNIYFAIINNKIPSMKKGVRFKNC